MTERERLLAVFRDEKPDMTPWYADLSYWYTGRKAMGSLDRKYEGEEGYVGLHRDAGVGIYLFAPQVWKEEAGEGIKVEQERNGNEIFTGISTPAGKIRSVERYLPGSYTTAYVEHYIKEPGDLKVMRYYFKNRRISPSFDDFNRIDRLWGEWGMPVLLSPVCTSPLQTLITRWAGIQTTVFLLADAREEVERTISEIEESDSAIFEIIAGSPARIVEFPENLSGEVTGAKLIEKYEMPYWKKRIKQLRDTGKLLAIHNDGTLKQSLPLLIDTGFDAVESITPAPVGDMTNEEIREMAGDRLIVWGGLPAALFSPVYSEDFFAEYLNKALDIFPPGSKFILSAADEVPPDSEFERICLVRKILNARRR